MKTKDIVILGGTGFVGGHLAHRLAAEGHRLRLLPRDPERRRDLRVLPTAELIAADVHDPRELVRHMEGADAVLNLVGILNERGDSGTGFRRVHVELAEKVVRAMNETGVRRLLHMSALNADAQRGPSHYLRTKGQAEDLVHAAAGLEVTSFRPSVIFGPGDSFFTRFARLLRLAPGIFPLAMGRARFAPVYVEDVVHCYATALADPHTIGRRYDLCGPRVYTLKELVEFTARVIGVRRKVISLGPVLSALQANVLEYVPGKPFSRDNYRSLQVDAVCREPFPDIFGITPQGIEAVVPQYLGGRRMRARYQEFRRLARHEA